MENTCAYLAEPASPQEIASLAPDARLPRLRRMVWTDKAFSDALFIFPFTAGEERMPEQNFSLLDHRKGVSTE